MKFTRACNVIFSVLYKVDVMVSKHFHVFSTSLYCLFFPDVCRSEGQADLQPWLCIWWKRFPWCDPSKCHATVWSGASRCGGIITCVLLPYGMGKASVRNSVVYHRVPSFMLCCIVGPIDSRVFTDVMLIFMHYRLTAN